MSNKTATQLARAVSPGHKLRLACIPTQRKSARVSHWLLALLLVSFSQNALARLYKVELIIFTNEGVSAEQWDFGSEATTKKLTQHNKSSARSREPVNPIGLSNLANIRTRIAQSSDHRILKTLSWTQSSASYANSPLIRVDSPGYQLDGTVRVYAPNLLFTEFNLRYHPGVISPPQFAMPDIEQYFLQEKRRLKLEEVHYFDHPKFGAVLTVRPIETK